MGQTHGQTIGTVANLLNWRVGSLGAIVFAVMLMATAAGAAPMRVPAISLDVSAGTFSPQIGNKNARDFHKDVFSSREWLWQFAAGRYLPVDMQYDTEIGMLGVRLGVGRWSVSGKYTDAALAVDDPNRTRAASLRVTPVTASFMYRVHLLRQRWHIPLIAYASAGGAYYFWNGKGPFRESERNAAAEDEVHGCMPGLQGSVALAIDLDGASLSRARGYDMVSLYIEANGSWVTGFKFGGNAFSLSNYGLSAGLRIDI